MEDLAATLQNILSDEESMKQVQGLAQMLGLGGGDQQPAASASPPPAQNFDLGSLLSGLTSGQQSQLPQLPQNTGNFDINSLLSGLAGSQQNQTSQPSQSAGGFDLSSLLSSLNMGGANTDGSSSPPPQQDAFLIDPGQLMRIFGMLQSVKQDNPRTTFLRALRPLLKEERQHKVDEAIKIMQLLSLWPVLQESGILKNLLGGLTG